MRPAIKLSGGRLKKQFDESKLSLVVSDSFVFNLFFVWSILVKLTILRALPGAGKSTATVPLEAAGAAVASADNFPGLYTYNVDGTVSIDVTKLDEAHGASYRTAIEALQSGQDCVVDNTNLSADEVLPYVAIAQAFRADCAIVTLKVNPETAFARQTHGVPREVFFDRMVPTFEAFEPPFHWQFLSWLETYEVSS